jgi:hypothetical protein
MKKYINNINTAQFIKIIYLLIVFVSITGILHSQPTGPGTDPDVPIDGGISLLIAGGVIYGVKELRKKRNNNSEN